MPRLFLFVVLFIAGGVLAPPAMATREEFRTRYRGERVAGSEICFFPAAADDGFFQKFFTSNRVRCLPADSLIEMARGNWNFFAQHPGGFVSVHPDFYIRPLDDPGDEGDDGYAATAMELVPSGTLDFASVLPKLAPGESVAVYLPNRDHLESTAVIRPLAMGSTTLQVPADAEIVPLIVRAGMPVRAFDVIRVRAAERREITDLPTGKGPDLFVLIRLQSADMRRAAPTAPSVTLKGGAHTRNPLVAPRESFRIDRSLAIFRNVPPGQYSVYLHGRGWKDAELPLTVTATGSSLAQQQFLPATPAAEVAASWAIDQSFAESIWTTHVPCGTERSAPRDETATLTLLRCDTEARELDAARCTVVAKRSLGKSDLDGQEVFQADEGGLYGLRLAHGNFSASSELFPLDVTAPNTVQLRLAPVLSHGTVTYGDAPLASRLLFSNAEAVSNDSGRFSAAFLGPARGTVIVRACDGSTSYQHVLQAPLAPGETIDIAIPRNEVNATVLEAETDRALVSARVLLSPLTGDDDTEAYFLEAATDAAGTATFRTLPTKIRLRVCAYYREREKACEEVTDLPSRGTKSVTLRLQQAGLRKGVVRSATPFIQGRIFIVDPIGGLLERANLQPDGRFTVRREPPPGGYFVITAASHPLAILPSMSESSTEIELTFPSGPHRMFSVRSTRPDTRAAITLGIGARVVPRAAFDAHQVVRNRNSYIYSTDSLVVSEILESGPITVFSAPLEMTADPNVDIFASPAILMTLQRRVVESAEVEFD